MHSFNFYEDIQEIIIDLKAAHIWDITSVAILNNVIDKFEKRGVKVQTHGLNESSRLMIEKYSSEANMA